MPIPKTETPNSSNIHSFSYENGLLTVQFKRKNKDGEYEPGGVYQGEVPEDVAQSLLKTHTEGGSVGSFFHHHVKSNEDIPAFKRIS